eukprot:gnl/Hemi2/13931_TR4728_c0_g1_i1.p1 gnl/Hemi2/13931_TR4728_c0_g1~~gnl/Hemi2/13931_TR4728_c0_g1_i1.p1  ORF type:complete len:367 (+),score=63.24 gnl/Hemi2/13931_TR4728_c0_g1_i1:147-1247(+)
MFVSASACGFAAAKAGCAVASTKRALLRGCASTDATATTFAGRLFASSPIRVAPKPPVILITGSLGQIGTELVPLLGRKYGSHNVIATDVRRPPELKERFAFANVMDCSALEKVIVDNGVTWIIHNACMLSAAGEKNHELALKINVDGSRNVLELARRHGCRVLSPSSIAVFGPSAPKDNTPDNCILQPTTIYGISKLFLEQLGEWYFQKHGLDFRSLRYPGIISSECLIGGGTTDYAIEMYFAAAKKAPYKCFLKEDQRLPMMYMPDCLSATVNLLEAPKECLTQRVYNVGAMDFTPSEQHQAILKHVPDFKVSYEPDFRQNIAASWPHSLDCSAAVRDWGWKPAYDLSGMSKSMLENIAKQQQQ